MAKKNSLRRVYASPGAEIVVQRIDGQKNTAILLKMGNGYRVVAYIPNQSKAERFVEALDILLVSAAAPQPDHAEVYDPDVKVFEENLR